jgi:hypothetical protein
MMYNTDKTRDMVVRPLNKWRQLFSSGAELLRLPPPNCNQRTLVL